MAQQAEATADQVARNLRAETDNVAVLLAALLQDGELRQSATRSWCCRTAGWNRWDRRWSCSTWLKHPRVCNYGSLRWEPAVLDTYARYFLKYVEAYRAEGVAVAQVHVQNEPATAATPGNTRTTFST